MSSIVHFLHSLPPEILLGGIFLWCMGGLLLTIRFFGLWGLFGYTVLAIFVSNIQVLRAAQFSFSPDPIALGTIVFSSTFLITDIVTEYYSKETAMKIVWFGFLAMLVMTGLMILTIGITPLEPTEAQIDYERFYISHQAMKTLFLPAPALFLASLISYLVSQTNDVFVFNYLKRVTHKKFLWLRAGLSTMISSLIDTILFSTLAWVVFADDPLDMTTLIWSYIIGTYGLRLLMSVVNVPLVYAAGKLLPKGDSCA